MSLIAPAYLDRMFAERDEASLTLLSSVICGAQAFDPGHATYGLPSSLFLFVEDLLWFAQSWRSGSWTYFEATPLERQQAILEELRTHAPEGWADQYALVCAIGRTQNGSALSILGSKDGTKQIPHSSGAIWRSIAPSSKRFSDDRRLGSPYLGGWTLDLLRIAFRQSPTKLTGCGCAIP